MQKFKGLLTNKRKWIEWLFIANASLLGFFPLILFVETSRYAQLFYYLNREPTLITTGTVTKSRVVYSRYSNVYFGTYNHAFRFEYKVNGTKYTSSNRVFSTASSLRPKESLNQQAARYKEGATYPIYYLGKYPHFSAMRNEWKGQWECLCSLVLFLFSAALFAKLFVLRRQYDTAHVKTP